MAEAASAPAAAVAAPGTDFSGMLRAFSRRADIMFAVIILLGGMGFVADRLFALMQQNILWRYQAGR